MPYMNYSPDDDGGSNLTVGPGGGFGPGGGPGGGGGQEAFMEMLAQARMDKLRRQREEEALAEREMLLREGQAGQAASGERDRRRFAETELRGRERGEGQRLALEGARTRSAMQISEEQRKEMQAQREAMSGFVPTSMVAGRPGIVGGRVRDPMKGTVRGQQIYGQKGSSFAPPGSAGLGPSAARIMKTPDEEQALDLATAGGGGGPSPQEQANVQVREATARRMKRYGY